jgi:hypothetical protein
MLPFLSMLQIFNKFSEDFCCGNYRYLGGSKEQWQKIAEMQIMLQNVNKFSEVQTYFRKLSF